MPRIAVRMEGGSVAEVRGVVGGRRQELEGALVDTAVAKIQDLPGGKEYFKKADDMKRLTALERKIVADPEVVLSREEVRFLYELDNKIEGFGQERDPRIVQLIGMRAGRDWQEISRILPEMIREQMSSATAAYTIVADQLGGEHGPATVSPLELQVLFAQKDRDWREHGVYDYIIERYRQHGDRFILVAVPNVAVSGQQAVALAEAFGTANPRRTQMYSQGRLGQMYSQDRYSGHAWSGMTGDAPVRFSLIPSRPDLTLSSGTIDDHLRTLRERQARQPELHYHVPSVLEAITYWNTLRARGDYLDAENTCICHFDMDPQQIDGSTWLPYSSVYANDKPFLGIYECDSRLAASVGRAAVG